MTYAREQDLRSPENESFAASFIHLKLKRVCEDDWNKIMCSPEG